MAKIGLIGGGLLILFVLVALISGDNSTLPQKIERECKKSYGSQGETAVLECQANMSIRYLQDAEKDRASSTYGRIR
ncbi:hypothetical protein ASF08_19480 [Methylobacterium sp. Leaf85]|nr:hypothetical protein ASF08_19480 [Methylobacterium sp. Leaf85]